MTLSSEGILSNDQPTKLRKAVGYCRVSSKAQITKGHGLASQEARIREYAKWKGYDIVEMFTDNITGGEAKRPGMDALIAHLRRNKREGRTVLLDDMSRFAKDVEGHAALRRLMREANGHLETPIMEFKDDADSRLFEMVLATVHQHQREKNAEQTRNRMRGRLLNGYWPFSSCIGYRYEHRAGEGKVLVRDEPLASIIREGLEGYANGRFQLQAEVKRFFETFAEFPRDRFGVVRNQFVTDILTKLLYTGYVEGPAGWEVSLRKGRHEALISMETFQKIQVRLGIVARVPSRADISADFPLRGAVVCAECGHPLTACWSTSKTGMKHAYYYCFHRGCDRNRKSIKRDVIESQFVSMLEALSPSRKLYELIRAMAKKAWSQQSEYAQALAIGFDREIRNLEKQASRLAYRIAHTDSDVVSEALEARVVELEREKSVLLEKREGTYQPKDTFEEKFELAFSFFAKPGKLWRSGRLDWQRLVLQLVFSENLAYGADGAFRTPKTTMPFSMLGDSKRPISKMAEREAAHVKSSPVRRCPNRSTLQRVALARARRYVHCRPTAASVNVG